jgi:Leucine-rich repeat (LRR) protein
MKRPLFRSANLLLVLIMLLSLLVTKATASNQAFSCAGVTEIPISECNALVTLFNTTDGPNWRTKWLLSDTPSTWHGVTVSNGFVTSINLYDNLLKGSIPAALANLPYLQELYLSANQLTGSIPPQLANLTNLNVLFVYGNQLSGNIPPELGNLHNLYNLDFSNNQLSGTIPIELGNCTSLGFLWLQDNKLSGMIPAELGNLSHLRVFHVANNQLTGTIPTSIWSIPSLVFFSISNNPMTGPIPAALWTNTGLLYLALDHTQLSGSIPTTIGNLTNLTDLDLSSGYFTGALPAEIGQMANLTKLYLNDNQFTGSIPEEIGNLASLTKLYLDHNRFTGSIPQSLTNLVNINNPSQTDGASLRLDYNYLTVPDPYPSTPPTALETYLDQKNPGWQTTQGIVKQIDSSGGQVTSVDGRVTVNIPTGGVTQPTVLVMGYQTHPSQSTGLLGFANLSFTLTAYDSDGVLISPFTFSKPVQFTLTYQDSDIEGLKESDLRLFYWDDFLKSWQDAAQTCALPGEYARDPDHNQLGLSVCHLSEFALLANRQLNYRLVLPVLWKP